MKNSYIIVISFLLISFACNQKKTVEEIYKDQKVIIDLSASPTLGAAPLDVDFSAYLETKTTAIERKIHHVKWKILGPGGFKREIIQESRNYQQNESDKECFFHLSYSFGTAGKYRVRLILNEGEYISKTITITAKELGAPNYRRY
ncbi:MAG: hypothetical protein CR997_13075 [Acidobacteria bacterium]|nr:MAG: hypothetical protein CR997_13075 [Acidobacteriota bacterium]